MWMERENQIYCLLIKSSFYGYRNGNRKKFVMIHDLTEHDNVCIAARDITGDGKVELAVGAQWNPSETGNAEQSGSVQWTNTVEIC
jgi:hypothetical protein